MLVKAVRKTADTGDLGQYVTALDSWDHRMERDSLAALVFARWLDQYREAVFAPEFERHGLDDSYYPSGWVVRHLDPESRWFSADLRAAGHGTCARRAISDIESEGRETYGAYNTTGAMTHPLGLDFLNYPALPTDGSRATVNNYAVENPTGSSWRMISSMGGPSSGILPGGNSGAYFSAHYDDQLRLWADGEYKSLDREIRGTPTLTFESGGEQ